MSVFFLCLFLVFGGGVNAYGRQVSADGKPGEGMYLQASLSSSRAVVGSDVVYEVAVVSPVASISLLGVPSSIQWGGLKAGAVNADSSLERVKVGGKDMYRAVIARYWLSSSEPGKYIVPSSEYVIGLAKERIVRDPFFGNMRSSYYEPVTLAVPSLSLRVDPLPKVPDSFVFSGAVGEFEVSVWIPEGYISADNDAIAMVTVAGSGNLSDARAPALLDAFDSTVRLKSVSEERTRYVRDGRLWSEIELEVTFVPHPDENGVCRILPVEFGYYSPEKGKYLKAMSEAVDVPLGGKSGKSKPPVTVGV